jgi:diguanylate cyclase (GGDEF)-like protein
VYATEGEARKVRRRKDVADTTLKGFRKGTMASENKIRRLLLISTDSGLALRVRRQLGTGRSHAYSTAHYSHLADALTYLKVSPVDVVLVEGVSEERTPGHVLQILSKSFPEIPLVGLLPQSSPGKEDALLSAGALQVLHTQEINHELWIRTLAFCQRENHLNIELATVTARLDWLSNTDALTGLLNRNGLEQLIMAEMARCRKTEKNLHILLVDLDDFSRINNTLGHGVGDLVLVGATRRIQESVRPQDEIGRCGLDRFLIMLSDTSEEEAEVTAEKIRLAIGRDVIQAGEHNLVTTASIGLTAIKPNALSFDEVLTKADVVLQQSKEKGKNRVARAASIEEVGMIRPVDTGPDMVRALLRGNVLQVASQPIVDLVDGRIVSREMLIRGPIGPLNRPDNLFRYCQENDILTAVDLRCMKLCAQAAAGLSRGTGYHVNIMPATLLQTPVEELIRVLGAHGGEGHCCLEISEQQLFSDPSVLVPCVRQLQMAGIHIAIDDVGFGNSCLEGLIMLQPQIMKIDKKLVQGLAVNSGLRHSLARLLKVAEVLGAEVVAEGIETHADCAVLKDLGVRMGQGYLFGRPQLCQEDTDANKKENSDQSLVDEPFGLLPETRLGEQA